jgi:lipoprotein-releasing system ATP-binding protein
MLLQAQSLTKKYGELPVLKGIDISIKQGEVVAIVGASGAGKSTLLQILGTLDKPDNGSVMIKDTDVVKLVGKELAAFRNKHIGFVFQFHNLLPEFTALENVCMPGYLGNRPQQEVIRKAKNLLDRLGLTDRMNHKPSQMSGGEQQRTAVARALVNEPSLILADEPSGNLDSNNAEDLHRLFFQLREEFNQTFIIVTHNPLLAAMTDRTLTMVDGKLLL